MRLGVLLEGHAELDWERWRRLAALVEELGFESLWLSDHLLSMKDGSRVALDVWAALAAAAAETARVQLGPLVCPVSFRHPAMLVKAVTTLDVLSGGRA